AGSGRGREEGGCGVEWRRSRRDERGEAMNCRHSSRVAIAVAAALLASCAVGPDYKVPEAPSATAYRETPTPEQTESAPVQAGEAQRFQVGAKIAADWWTIFGSPELDALIKAAL